ncbi:MAG: ABC transporter ATP-binding protein [Hyphomonadaceae bacterium]|nr:ABC transporter ATP-binding protein [Hyphomonadaceae bacterium]
MLHIENVGKSFGALTVLRGINLEAAAGRITGIIGPNGAGKSTLLNVVGGLFPNDTGRILLDGTDVTPLPMHERARCGLVRTFQISRELGELTVLENLMLARQAQTGEAVLGALLRPGSVAREERAAVLEAKGLLDNVGLWRLADQSARALSGGQKKLLELSRALMLKPKIILLDEPAAGVSPPMRLEISKVIRGLCQDGMTFVIVEHDMDMIASLCDQVYVMAEGKNLTSGTFGEVVADDRVVRAYLGGVA